MLAMKAQKARETWSAQKEKKSDEIMRAKIAYDKNIADK